jgi:hypothetical protein
MFVALSGTGTNQGFNQTQYWDFSMKPERIVHLKDFPKWTGNLEGKWDEVPLTLQT